MNHVCIFGDSWSYQSKKKMPNLEESVGTQTFQKMFAEYNINSFNGSIRGASNFNIIRSINNNYQHIIESDIIIVFQTDPLRDILSRKTFKFNHNIDLSRCSTLIDISKLFLSEFYNQLSELQIYFNKPILLIGGLSCIDFENVPPNIHTMKQSWTELVTPEFVDCFFEWVDFVDIVSEYLNTEFNYVSNLIEIKKQISAKNYIWQNSDAFGWAHPSDTGYKLMFDSINTYLTDAIMFNTPLTKVTK